MPTGKQTPAQAGSGSPAGEPLFLVVGFLRRPHGVRGEIVMDLHTDFPERLRVGRKLFVGEQHKPLTLEGVRPHARSVLIKFRGMETPEDAGQYRNQWVYVKASEAPALPQGQIYQHELYGMTVIDDTGQTLGKITEIIVTGANDVYVVTDDAGREILLPAIPPVILDIDAGRRLIRVHLLEGLIPGGR